MQRTAARIALRVLVFLASSSIAGCKLPAQVLQKLVAPRPTPTATPLPARQVNAEFVQINDDRVRGEGDTAKASIEVQIPGTKISEVVAARVVVKNVVDDLGTNLVPDKAPEARFEPVQGIAEAPVSISVPMKNASRKAKLLNEVTADVELYTPSLDPAALITIPRFMEQAGKPIVNPLLKAAGVDVAILSPAQIEQEKKAYGERKLSEAKKLGLQGEMLETTVRLAVDSYLSLGLGGVLLKVSDPNERIQDYVFLYPAGEAQQVNRGMESGFVVLGAQGEDPKPDWGLQVRLRTPKTFQRCTFTLRDVPLP